MLGDLFDLRDTLLTARLLREEILDLPLAPPLAAELRERFRQENAPGGCDAALAVALARGSEPDLVLVDERVLAEIAEAAGGTGGAAPRVAPGLPFGAAAAPRPGQIPQLTRELLDTVNSPVAVESWPAPVRAFALHFLLRLVQPFAAPAVAVAACAEALLLAADHFRADQMLLPEPEIGADPGPGRPDPDAFVRARAHRMVERLGESRDRVRDAAAREVLATWVERREARLNPRQARFVRHLAEAPSERLVGFQDYVDLHAGRRAPSLRTLQRDWQALRERGLLRPEGEEWRLDLRGVTFGRG